MEALTFNLKTKELVYDKKREIPKIIKDNDVIIKVLYSGVCGTDLHIMEGNFPCTDTGPFVMGHEFGGVVVECGSKGTFRPGQRVVVDPNSGCNVCAVCHNGQYSLCERGGLETTIGIQIDGGWAQYCRVPDTQILELPESVPDEHVGLCEPLSCLARGWDRAGKMAIGENILIMGAGIIGNLWATLFHLQGHKRVTISEPNKDRLATVTKMGLGYKCVTPDEIVAAKATFDVIVDCTGVAAAMEASLPLLRPAGRYVLFGCANPKSTVRINPYEMFSKELTILGVKINPFTFTKAIGLLDSMGERYLNYEKLGIELFPLSKYKEAFEKLKGGTISKAMFKLNRNEMSSL